jgi:GTP-binding protein Era
MMADQGPEEFRAGYVTLIGEPNVGKSTLMNALLQQKISIVTPKPQTTRHRVLGILSSAEFQLIMLDTPGIIAPRYALHHAMMAAARSALQDADCVLLMIDAANARKGDDGALKESFAMLRDAHRPVLLVVNKIDVAVKSSLPSLVESYTAWFPFKEIHLISALKGDGTAALLQSMRRELPVHPAYYPLDIVSEQNDRFFVSEIVREKIFLRCREEVPYSTAVDIVEFKEREEGKWFISADVYVERDSQKAILIGKKGAMLKEIGQSAREDIERFLDHPVFLELHVKVRQKWRDDEQWLRRLGYSNREKHED